MIQSSSRLSRRAHPFRQISSLSLDLEFSSAAARSGQEERAVEDRLQPECQQQKARQRHQRGPLLTTAHVAEGDSSVIQAEFEETVSCVPEQN